MLPADMEPHEWFVMFRILFEPGSVLPIDADDLATALVYVEQGTLTSTVDQETTVSHAGTGNLGLTEQDFETMAAGQESTMTVGDSALFPVFSSGDASNDGTEEVVVLVAQFEPPGNSGEVSATPGAGEEVATPSS